MRMCKVCYFLLGFECASVSTYLSRVRTVDDLLSDQRTSSSFWWTFSFQLEFGRLSSLWGQQQQQRRQKQQCGVFLATISSGFEFFLCHAASRLLLSTRVPLDCELCTQYVILSHGFSYNHHLKAAGCWLLLWGSFLRYPGTPLK